MVAIDHNLIRRLRIRRERREKKRKARHFSTPRNRWESKRKTA